MYSLFYSIFRYHICVADAAAAALQERPWLVDFRQSPSSEETPSTGCFCVEKAKISDLITLRQLKLLRYVVSAKELPLPPHPPPPKKKHGSKPISIFWRTARANYVTRRKHGHKISSLETMAGQNRHEASDGVLSCRLSRRSKNRSMWLPLESLSKIWKTGHKS